MLEIYLAHYWLFRFDLTGTPDSLDDDLPSAMKLHFKFIWSSLRLGSLNTLSRISLYCEPNHARALKWRLRSLFAVG